MSLSSKGEKAIQRDVKGSPYIVLAGHMIVGVLPRSERKKCRHKFDYLYGYASINGWKRGCQKCGALAR